MSQQIRNALKWLTGPSSMTPSSMPGGSGPPSIPPGRNLPAPPPDVPPPPSGRNLPPPPDAPAPRNLPGPTAPDVPARGNGWGAALGAGAALAAGGGVLGYVIDAMNGGGNQAPPPQPPAPPPPPPFPEVDPKTATREEMRAAGYRDYGGGWVAPGTPATRGQRERFFKDQARRYRTQIAENPKIYGDIVAAYDQANVTNAPGSAHSARAVATRALTAHLDAQKEAQIWTNIDNRAKQQNVAMQMGVDRGYVMAMEDVQRHAAKGDVASASAAAAMYSQRYGPGFLYAAKNMTDQHSASERAKAEMAGQKPPPQTVAQSVNKNMAEIQAMPPGPARKAAIEQFYSAGSSGDPKAAKAGVENHYQTIVKDMAGRLDKLSPEETSELQQVAGHMNYQQFLKYSGAVDNADTQQHYQRIFNKNATWAQANEQLGPLGTLRDYAVPDWLFPGWK